MCGLAGFINFNQNRQLAKLAGEVQQHRGPDAQNTWQHDNIALSHQRLSIIDLDHRADQPIIKNGLAIIFNGEIYNYKELKEEILKADPAVQFITSSDTEVLLELYRLKKEKCLDDLVGMFAFAVYEIQTGLLFLARDHFGIKPLFYTQIGNAFAFASELKTLVKVPGFDKTINTKTLTAALNYLWIPGNETMFCNSLKLPAAHYLMLDTKSEKLSLVIRPYWNVQPAAIEMDEKEALQKLEKSLQESVKRHMVADVPVSSFLSGGLDSSLISVMASEINPGLSTYTISTTANDKMAEQMPADEKYARQLARQFGFQHHEIELKPDIIHDLPAMVYTLDEPIGDPAAINTYLICKAAKAKGVKVLLSGMGADEIFFGYRRQKATLLAQYYKRLPSPLHAFVRSIVNTLPVKKGKKGIKIFRWAKRFLSFAALPPEQAYRMSYSYYSPADLKQLFKQDIESALVDLQQQHEKIFNQHSELDLVNKMCFTDIHYFMQGLNLTYTDRASMAASVEVRVPFIDKEVVSLAMQFDGKLKYKNRQTKYLLKKVAEKYLPKEIIYRPKASFGAPIRSWISGALKPMVDDLLSSRAVEQRGLFNYDYIQKLIDDDRNGLEDNAYRVYQLLTLELWFRQYIDTPEAVNPSHTANFASFETNN